MKKEASPPQCLSIASVTTILLNHTKELVRPTGFEPATCGFEVQAGRSTQKQIIAQTYLSLKGLVMLCDSNAPNNLCSCSCDRAQKWAHRFQISNRISNRITPERRVQAGSTGKGLIVRERFGFAFVKPHWALRGLGNPARHYKSILF
ncbi:MAG: hypothetical protein LAO21_20260 [Acidobacteriia bacterium]|nr:hypothetical protein [Terriglobia bacterium]